LKGVGRQRYYPWAAAATEPSDNIENREILTELRAESPAESAILCKLGEVWQNATSPVRLKVECRDGAKGYRRRDEIEDVRMEGCERRDEIEKIKAGLKALATKKPSVRLNRMPRSSLSRREREDAWQGDESKEMDNLQNEEGNTKNQRMGWPHASDLLEAGGTSALASYLMEHPESARRIQDEMREMPLLSPTSRKRVDLLVDNSPSMPVAAAWEEGVEGADRVEKEVLSVEMIECLEKELKQELESFWEYRTSA